MDVGVGFVLTVLGLSLCSRFRVSSFEFQDLGLSFGLQYCGHRLGFDWGKDRALKLDYVNVRYMVPERTSINRKTGV